MLIIPAVDIRGGNCVRLYQGKLEQETVYSRDPVFVANLWKAKGARRLHVADLDGAFTGVPQNLELTLRIAQECGIPIQAGGGFRDIKTIRKALKGGVDRVILGTVAVYNPDLVRQAVEELGSHIAVSIDVTDDKVAIAGWKDITVLHYEDLIARMTRLGVAELLFTDTRRDGTLAGPNVEAIQRFLSSVKVPVIASGGISSLDDIRALKNLEPSGLSGVIIGKALYTETVSLEEAIKIAEAQC